MGTIAPPTNGGVGSEQQVGVILVDQPVVERLRDGGRALVVVDRHLDRPPEQASGLVDLIEPSVIDRLVFRRWSRERASQAEGAANHHRLLVGGLNRRNGQGQGPDAAQQARQKRLPIRVHCRCLLVTSAPGSRGLTSLSHGMRTWDTDRAWPDHTRGVRRRPTWLGNSSAIPRHICYKLISLSRDVSTRQTEFTSLRPIVGCLWQTKLAHTSSRLLDREGICSDSIALSLARGGRASRC